MPVVPSTTDGTRMYPCRAANPAMIPARRTSDKVRWGADCAGPGRRLGAQPSDDLITSPSPGGGMEEAAGSRARREAGAPGGGCPPAAPQQRHGTRTGARSYWMDWRAVPRYVRWASRLSAGAPRHRPRQAWVMQLPVVPEVSLPSDRAASRREAGRGFPPSPRCQFRSRCKWNPWISAGEPCPVWAGFNRQAGFPAAKGPLS